MTVYSEWEAKERLGERLPRPRERLTRSLPEALAFAAELAPGRLVAKASGVAHKTERHGVRLGLDRDALAACWPELAATGDGTVLVAEEVVGELELIVGGLRDRAFGPVVSVGIGGTAAELRPDTAYLLAPPEPGELDAAIAQLRAAPLLDGYRGRPPVDRAALAAVVGAVSDLLTCDPAVAEIDLNPVAVRGGQPIVLDALVVTSSPDTSPHGQPVSPTGARS